MNNDQSPVNSQPLLLTLTYVAVNVVIDCIIHDHYVIFN
jgi:hypothetical protein